MVIYSFFYGWKGDILVELLDKKSSDEEVHREAINILKVDGAVDYAKEKARLVKKKGMGRHREPSSFQLSKR